MKDWIEEQKKTQKWESCRRQIMSFLE